MDLLEKIRTNGLCHGCGACAATVPSKISMTMSTAGWLRPRTSAALSADDESLVRAVCSGREISHENSEASERQRVPYNPQWGPILSVETGYSTDPEVRFQGSSGAVITAIAIDLLRTGAVDFVVQTSASTTDPVGNVTRISRTPADIVRAAGSRYAPSSPLADMEQYLQSGERFAFIGKPCDVAALKRMGRMDARITQQVPYTLSFFCAGVPSRRGALAVLDALGVEECDVASFAYRGQGWPGLARARRHDGTEETMDYGNSWGNILNRYLQFRCKICPDGIGEFADIVCADAWYGADGYPDFAEADGRSLIVARTQNGRLLLDAMQADKIIAVTPLGVDQIALMQPYQATRKGTVPVRLLAMRLKGLATPRYRGLKLFSSLARTPILWLVRNFFGTLRRLNGRKIED